MSELCTAAGVSHRRLGAAFNEVFDCSPTVYFRTWALDRAHRRLREADPREQTVTEVAAALGFHHLGRFASHYRSV
jgi:AraC-like DNA-binding protein